MKTLWIITDSDIEHDLVKLAIKMLHADINIRVVSDMGQALIDLNDRQLPIPEYIMLDTEYGLIGAASTKSLLSANEHMFSTKLILYGPPAQATDMASLLGKGAQSYLLKSYSFSAFCKDLNRVLSR